jgi:hypothetical protein
LRLDDTIIGHMCVRNSRIEFGEGSRGATISREKMEDEKTISIEANTANLLKPAP